jgi:phage-related protein
MSDFSTNLIFKSDFENGAQGSWYIQVNAALSVHNGGYDSFSKHLRVDARASGLVDVREYLNTAVPAHSGMRVYRAGWVFVPAGGRAVTLAVRVINKDGSTHSYAGPTASGSGYQYVSATIELQGANVAMILPGVARMYATSASDYFYLGPQECSFLDPDKPVWAWLPDQPPADDRAPRVLTAQFGDGYSQRVRDGLNTNLESWQLTFEGRTLADIAEMRAFLDARGAAEAFQWIAPDNWTTAPNVPDAGNPKLYLCKKWNVKRLGGNYATLSATFDEVPM